MLWQQEIIYMPSITIKALTVLATAGLIDGSGHGDCGDSRG